MKRSCHYSRLVRIGTGQCVPQGESHVTFLFRDRRQEFRPTASLAARTESDRAGDSVITFDNESDEVIVYAPETTGDSEQPLLYWRLNAGSNSEQHLRILLQNFGEFFVNGT